MTAMLGQDSPEDVLDAYDLMVLHVDDLGLDRVIETGLQVAIDDERRQAILPFKDGMVAEEVSRIICGTLKREMT